ncbi:MAG: hypothetical protein CME71_09160 [Halobacteriovorax sp.]|nr:hypothetical protein [Halobacteriovorax sp.]
MKRVSLRRFSESDLDAICLMEADQEVMAMTGPARAQTRLESKARLDKILGFSDPRPYTGYWAGIDSSSGQLVAWFMLLPVVDKPETFEIGFMVRRDCWGKGYAREFAQSLLSLIESGSGIRVIAKTSPKNEASKKVLLKCGFQELESEDLVQFVKVI